MQYYTTLKNRPNTRTYTRRLSEDDLPRGPAVPRTGDPPLQTIIRANRRLPKREPLISPVPPPRLAAWHRCRHHGSYHDDDDGNNRWRAHCPLPLDSCHAQNAAYSRDMCTMKVKLLCRGCQHPLKVWLDLAIFHWFWSVVHNTHAMWFSCNMSCDNLRDIMWFQKRDYLLHDLQECTHAMVLRDLDHPSEPLISSQHKNKTHTCRSIDYI